MSGLRQRERRKNSFNDDTEFGSTFKIFPETTEISFENDYDELKKNKKSRNQCLTCRCFIVSILLLLSFVLVGYYFTRNRIDYKNISDKIKKRIPEFKEMITRNIPNIQSFQKDSDSTQILKSHDTEPHETSQVENQPSKHQSPIENHSSPIETQPPINTQSIENQHFEQPAPPQPIENEHQPTIQPSIQPAIQPNIQPNIQPSIEKHDDVNVLSNDQKNYDQEEIDSIVDEFMDFVRQKPSFVDHSKSSQTKSTQTKSSQTKSTKKVEKPVVKFYDHGQQHLVLKDWINAAKNGIIQYPKGLTILHFDSRMKFIF